MTIPSNQTILPLITAPEFNTEFLWQLTLVFALLAIVYFVAVFVIRNKIGKKTRRTKEKKIEFSPMISEFLFYEDTNKKEEKKNYLDLKIRIRELIKNSFDRKVLIEVLLDLRKDLSGQSQEVLLELYVDLGLHNDSYEKLNSRHWPIISKGILELTAMNVTESYGMILNLINHRNGTIRKQAELAIVNLKEEGISFFLDNTKFKISEWQQLKLLDVLRHKENFTPPKFSLWLTSNNTHVVLFSLRLIKYYKQSDARKSIVTLLKHKNNAIKLEAIECVKEFYILESLITLKLIYWKSNTGVKITILDAIGEIGEREDIEFLKMVAVREKNYTIKSKVLGTINKIDPEHEMPTKNIEDLSYYTKEVEEKTNEETEIQDASIVREVHIADETNEELEDSVIKVSRMDEEDIANTSLEKNKIVEDAKIDDSTDLNPENELEKIVMTESVRELDLNRKQSPSDELALEKKLSFDFLPIIVEDEIKINEAKTVVEHIVFSPEFLLDVDFLESSLNEVSPNQINNKSDVDSIEIDWNKLLNDEAQNLEESPLIETNESLEEASISPSKEESFSVKPNFLNDADLEIMVLLEDVEDLGDERELGLLYQLMEEESSPIILDRVAELIAKISDNCSNNKNQKKPPLKYEKSVFEELFELSDKETRIVLLNEMANSGGSKEISLLKQINKHNDPELVKLAELALDRISERKRSGFDNEFDQQFNNYLKIDFELIMEDLPRKPVEINDLYNRETLFDHLCSFSNNIYNRKNG